MNLKLKPPSFEVRLEKHISFKTEPITISNVVKQILNFQKLKF